MQPDRWREVGWPLWWAIRSRLFVEFGLLIAAFGVMWLSLTHELAGGNTDKPGFAPPDDHSNLLSEPTEPMPEDKLLSQGEPGGIDDVDVWLMSTVAMIPMAAVVALVIGFHWTRSAGDAVLAGSVVGLVLVVVLYAVYIRFHFNEAKHASVDTYNDLCSRMARVASQKVNIPSNAEAFRREAAVNARQTIMGSIEAFKFFRKKKGLQWVLGKGYLDLLRIVHRCEEAAIMYEPVDVLLSEAAKDRRRLIGANTPQRQQLLNQLAEALVLIDPKLMDILKDVRQQPASTATDGKNSLLPEDGRQADLDESRRRTLGRQLLRDVRFAVNEFRDASRGSLIEARNNLVARMFLTALTTSLLVLFIVVAANPDNSNSIVAGAVLYGVGAMVGLFSRLYADLSRQSAGGDYGFSHVRLFQTFLVSGLAGVAGVYVAVALPVLSSQLPHPTGSGLQSGTPDLAALSTIFDLEHFPAAILFAAVFGLAPGLLFDRLWGTIDQYRENLKSSEPTPALTSPATDTQSSQ